MREALEIFVNVDGTVERGGGRLESNLKFREEQLRVWVRLGNKKLSMYNLP